MKASDALVYRLLQPIFTLLFRILYNPKYVNKVSEHLEYPDYSIYLLLEESAKKREGLIAYIFYLKQNLKK